MFVVIPTHFGKVGMGIANKINISKSLRILAGDADIIIVLYLLSVKHTLVLSKPLIMRYL